MKKWFIFWIAVLVVLIFVYHEEPPKIEAMVEYKQNYDFDMQEPYAQKLVFANKLDEVEHREYLRVYSYDEGKSLIKRLIKGESAVVTIDAGSYSLEAVTAENAALAQQKINDMAKAMKQLYLLPDGRNVHKIFDERIPKATDADYVYVNEAANGNYFVALFIEKTGELHTFEWRE